MYDRATCLWTLLWRIVQHHPRLSKLQACRGGDGGGRGGAGAVRLAGVPAELPCIASQHPLLHSPSCRACSGAPTSASGSRCSWCALGGCGGRAGLHLCWPARQRLCTWHLAPGTFHALPATTRAGQQGARLRTDGAGGDPGRHGGGHRPAGAWRGVVHQAGAVPPHVPSEAPKLKRCAREAARHQPAHSHLPPPSASSSLSPPPSSTRQSTGEANTELLKETGGGAFDDLVSAVGCGWCLGVGGWGLGAGGWGPTKEPPGVRCSALPPALPWPAPTHHPAAAAAHGAGAVHPQPGGGRGGEG